VIRVMFRVTHRNVPLIPPYTLAAFTLQAAEGGAKLRLRKSVWRGGADHGQAC
jgi:hypothetical protein